MMRARPVAVLAALAALATSGASRAAPSCRVVNVTPVTFGPYQAGQIASVDSVGEIDLACTDRAAVQVALGRSVSGRQAPRAMSGRDGTLTYDLFLDAAHTMPWGDGTQGTQTLQTVIAPGQTLRLLMYGRIFGGQSIPPGAYSDRLVVVVTF